MQTITLLCVIIACLVAVASTALVPNFKPPAVPLLTVDPQFSVWSPSVNLTESFSTQWTGTIKALVGLIRIDNEAYRFFGPADQAGGSMPKAIAQTNLQVFPTRSIFTFANAKVKLEVTFSTPLLTDDYFLMSRPVSFITIKVTPTGTSNIQVYLDSTGEIAVNKVEEEINWSKQQTTVDGVPLNIIRVGTTEQNVMGVTGDAVGINWGYFYLATKSSNAVTQGVATAVNARTTFAQTGALPKGADLQGPKRCNDDWPVIITVWNFGSISSEQEIVVAAAYDDIESIDFFGQKMKGYWTQKWSSIQSVIADAVKDYPMVMNKMIKFDTKLVDDLTRIGGPKYATIASLSYRQAMAGMKLVWNDKEKMPWFFLKEISSDGDIQTVDVIYPASPILLYLKPELLFLQMLPIMSYANNETWSKYTYEFSPHHLGYYPVCNIKSEGQENMPIEETANMMHMWAAVIQRSVDQKDIMAMTKRYWNLFQTWANYLVQNLPDPGEQLCTDDFEGPSPHNANLAAKGILGIAAYAQICNFMGRSTDAQKYNSIAQDYAKQWATLALDADRIHTKLEYDKNNTFSLKYNIYYQYVLNMTLLMDPQPDIKYYLNQKMNKYGVPLDNRATFTKLDWLYWIAAMGTDDQFAKFNEAGFNMAEATTRGIPLTDWYETTNAAIKGFRARPVVGGIYARMVLKK